MDLLKKGVLTLTYVRGLEWVDDMNRQLKLLNRSVKTLKEKLSFD
jgi:hypothetical protein